MEKKNMNTYEVKSIRSSVNPDTLLTVGGSIKDLIIRTIQSGNIVVWMYNEILFGKISDKKISYFGNEPQYEDYLVNLRAFNEKKELYIWRNNANGFNYRVREDEIGTDDTPYIDTAQVLLGTESKPADVPGWSVLTEGRGSRLVVPGVYTLANGKRLCIITRNYIEYNEIGQAGFIDSRFVKFEVK